MKYLIVLFNLRDGVSEEEYEAWAKEHDLPGVRRLSAVERFDVFRTTGTLHGNPAPYRYVELLEITDMEHLGKDTDNPINKEIAATFQGKLADSPIFMIADKLD